MSFITRTQSHACMAFHAIPEDLYIQFVKCMDICTLLKTCQVNKSLRTYSSNRALWKEYCLRDFGEFSAVIVDQYTATLSKVVNQQDICFYKLMYKEMLQWSLELYLIAGVGDTLFSTYKVSKKRPTTIGRSRKNSICLRTDATVSRKHCIITPGRNCYEIQNLAGSNVTLLNENEINHAADSKEPYLLCLGDEIRAGKCVLGVRLRVPKHKHLFVSEHFREMKETERFIEWMYG